MTVLLPQSLTRKKALSGLSATSIISFNLGVMGRYTGAVVVLVAVAAAAAVAEEGAAAMLGGRGGNKRKPRKIKGSKRGWQTLLEYSTGTQY